MLISRSRPRRVVCDVYQYLEEFLQVAGDECVVLVERPAALLGVVAVTGQVTEDHLQALLVVAHLALGQRCALVLQKQTRPLKQGTPVWRAHNPAG